MHPVVKNIIQYNAITTPSVWLFIFLFKSFAEWRIINPFQWIIDLPTYQPEQRGWTLAAYLGYQFVVCFLFFIKYDNQQNELKKNNPTQ